MKTKKSLGQHFLTSSKIVSDIVSTAHVKKGDRVLEIGPGMGVLTRELLSTGADITVIEKDDRLIPILTDMFAPEIQEKRLCIIHADVLEWENNIRKPYKVVANIPYYITGQIMRMFLESDNQPESMTLLVQKEVAQRIIARDGKESLLSLSVKVYGHPTLVRSVPAGAFNPPPNVDSAVLHVSELSKERFDQAHISEEKFFKIIHAGLAHKRKQLIPNLLSIYNKDALVSAFEKCSLDLHCRGEDLSVDTWVTLTQHLI
jgi:16S rRNA (adenine1518-N6/adenine1519-N6)-dimethyltransferase